MSDKFLDRLQSMSTEELEKSKLIEEIKELKKPTWRRLSFLSVVGSLVLTFAAVSVSIWQVQDDKMDELKTKLKELAKREEAAGVLYNEALVEKADAISQKTILNQQIKNWELSKREEELQTSVANLTFREKKLEDRIRILDEELAKRSGGYKRGFIASFVDKNQTVQADIQRFSTETNRQEFKKWLKAQFLWTALSRYEDYILKQVESASRQ